MSTPIKLSKVFDAPVDKVWDALSKEEALKEWYFPVENYKFEVGSEFTFYESTDSKKYLHRCKFLSIIPEKLIEHTWTHPSHSKGTSVLKWELEPKGSKTLVTLTHSGIENFEDGGPDFAKANYEMGWKAILNVQLRNYLYGIKKLVFDAEVEGTPHEVWNKLWDKENYKTWAEPFSPGTYYTGDLKQGERIHFLTPKGEGMYSDVAYVKEDELFIFSHIGMMKDNEELPVDDETEKWTGCFETYRLKPKGNKTLVKVEVDVVDQYADMMKNMFPQALNKLKNITNNN